MKTRISLYIKEEEIYVVLLNQKQRSLKKAMTATTIHGRQKLSSLRYINLRQKIQELTNITTNISRSAKIIDYFLLFVSEEFVQFIANETNHYLSKQNNNNIKDVEGTVVSELYCFLLCHF